MWIVSSHENSLELNKEGWCVASYVKNIKNVEDNNLFYWKRSIQLDREKNNNYNKNLITDEIIKNENNISGTGKYTLKRYINSENDPAVDDDDNASKK